MRIDVTFSQTEDLPVIFADKGGTISADIGAIQTRYIQHEEYDGATDVTPSNTIQTLYTANLVVGSDIVINPIPSNYGLISWSGRGIRVS